MTIIIYGDQNIQYEQHSNCIRGPVQSPVLYVSQSGRRPSQWRKFTCQSLGQVTPLFTWKLEIIKGMICVVKVNTGLWSEIEQVSLTLYSRKGNFSCSMKCMFLCSVKINSVIINQESRLDLVCWHYSTILLTLFSLLNQDLWVFHCVDKENNTRWQQVDCTGFAFSAALTPHFPC